MVKKCKEKKAKYGPQIKTFWGLRCATKGGISNIQHPISNYEVRGQKTGRNIEYPTSNIEL